MCKLLSAHQIVKIFLKKKNDVKYFNNFIDDIFERNIFWSTELNKTVLKPLSSILFFSGPHLWHMEVPRLGVELGLQLPTYAYTTATQDPSPVWDLHHSSRQHLILTH